MLSRCSAEQRIANKKDAFDGESRVALSDAKDATHQHGDATSRFLTAWADLGI